MLSTGLVSLLVASFLVSSCWADVDEGLSRDVPEVQCRGPEGCDADGAPGSPGGPSTFPGNLPTDKRLTGTKDEFISNLKLISSLRSMDAVAPRRAIRQAGLVLAVRPDNLFVSEGDNVTAVCRATSGQFTSMVTWNFIINSVPDDQIVLSGQFGETITYVNIPGVPGITLLHNCAANDSDGRRVVSGIAAIHIDIDNCFNSNYCLVRDGLVNSVCTNIFLTDRERCVCAPGYMGATCEVNVDECATGVHNCAAGTSTCTDVVGSFVCSCFPELCGNGVQCGNMSAVEGVPVPCGTNAVCTDDAGGITCQCSLGFNSTEAGNGIDCDNIDECVEESPCHADASCTDTVGSFSCACNTGFTGDGFNCTDVNECTQEPDPCDGNATCTNTFGNYFCTCDTGFAGSGTVCENINDCNLATCDTYADCTDVIGGFSCACNTGFTGDGFNCTDVDECTEVPDPCDDNATCSNTFGSFTCTCDTGFTGNGSDCENIDECNLASPPCDTNATCTDTVGSFDCVCRNGYTGNGLVCQNIDECLMSPSPCDADADCTDTHGSFNCVCRPGYTGNETVCENTIECNLPSPPCDTNADCTDTVGSFSCACNTGFTGNGLNCTDVDECTQEPGPCDGNTACINTLGSFTCTCDTGFTGIGTVCENIDECSLASPPCDSNANCADAFGSFTCTCDTGFTGNGTVCENIDECSLASPPCGSNAACTDTAGSFDCACRIGYSGNGLLCLDINECNDGSSSCPGDNRLCVNSIGSFRCDCQANFYGNDSNNCIASSNLLQGYVPPYPPARDSLSWTVTRFADNLLTNYRMVVIDLGTNPAAASFSVPPGITYASGNNVLTYTEVRDQTTSLTPPSAYYAAVFDIASFGENPTLTFTVGDDQPAASGSVENGPLVLGRSYTMFYQASAEPFQVRRTRQRRQTSVQGVVSSAYQPVQTTAVSPAEIVFGPTTERVNVNSTAVFMCMTTGDPAPSITWSRNGMLLTTNLYINTIIIGRPGLETAESTLSLPNVAFDTDQGVYQCIAQNGFGPVVRASASLIIYIPPVQLERLTDQTLLAGVTVTLFCRFSGTPVPRITWFREGVELRQNDLQGRVSFFRGMDVLTVFTAEVSDSGAYHCSASNVDQFAGAEISSNTAQQTINVVPTIDPPLPATLSTFQGSRTVLQCGYSGSPTPTARWCRSTNGRCDDTEQPGCPGFTVSAAGTRTTATYVSASPCHGGEYTCVVTNSAGLVRSSVMLTVRGAVNLGVRGDFSGPGILSTSRASDVRGLVMETLNAVFPASGLQVQHFSSEYTGGSTASVLVDFTVASNSLMPCQVNDSLSSVQFCLAMKFTPGTGPLTLDMTSANIFTYDVCSPEVRTSESRGEFNWPEAFADSTAMINCPRRLQNGMVRVATRFCATVPRPHNSMLTMAEWTMPDIGLCPTVTTQRLQTLALVQLNSTDEGAVLDSTTTVANLTAVGSALSADDVNFASTAIFNVVASVRTAGNFNQSVVRQIAGASLQSVDNILQVNSTVIGQSPASRIAKSMESIVTSVDVGVGEGFQAQGGSVGFALNCPAVGNGSEAFRSVTPGSSGAFFAGPVQTAASEASTGVAFDIPRSAILAATEQTPRSNASRCAVALTRYILYTASSLFNDTRVTGNVSVATSVISAQVGNGSMVGLNEPVMMSYDIVLGDQISEDQVTCVSWDFDLYDGVGGWSAAGCQLVRNASNPNRTTCQCNHLTNFAVLLAREGAVPPITAASEALRYISLIGSSLSMLALLATIIIILWIPSLRKRHHHQLLMGLSATLLVFLALLTVVLFDESIETASVTCKSLAIVLHYLLLCAFMWMSVDATFIYKQLIIVFNSESEKQQLFLHTAIFVVPLIIVGVSAAATKADAYGEDNLCWISGDAVFYAALVVPIILSVLYNFYVFIRVVYTIKRRGKRVATDSKDSGSTAKKNKLLLRTVVYLSVLMGLTWAFGFLVLADDNLAFQYIFTILNTMQGVGIFLHVIVDVAVRKRFAKLLGTKSSTVTSESKLVSINTPMSTMERRRSARTSTMTSTVGVSEHMDNTGHKRSPRVSMQSTTTVSATDQLPASSGSSASSSKRPSIDVISESKVAPEENVVAVNSVALETSSHSDSENTAVV